MGGGRGEGGRGFFLPVEGAGAVEELEVEGGGGLAVDFPAGAGLHGHLRGWKVGLACVSLSRYVFTVSPCHCCLAEVRKCGCRNLVELRMRRVVPRARGLLGEHFDLGR